VKWPVYANWPRERLVPTLTPKKSGTLGLRSSYTQKSFSSTNDLALVIGEYELATAQACVTDNLLLVLS
jgi:hypothetical protein